MTSETAAFGRGSSPYPVRRQRVRVGSEPAEVLVAVFPLRSGGAACLQLQDEGRLPRGGVYLLVKDDPAEPGIAPRIDELARGLQGVVGADARRARTLERLLRRAAKVARATRPRLSPGTLRRMGALVRSAHALGCEPLLAALLLLFVSEEERYPSPPHRGAELLLERLLGLLPSG